MCNIQASHVNAFRNATFFEEWSSYLDEQAIIPAEIILTGDLNFHLDDPNNIDSRRFLETLEVHGLCQRVVGATHNRGHTLDVLITRQSSRIFDGSPTIEDPSLFDSKGNSSGDHLAICAYLNILKSAREQKTISFRNFRNVSTVDLVNDITESKTLQSLHGSTDELVQRYNDGLRELLDKHAPLRTKLIIVRPNTPWYDDNLRDAKRKRRKAERIMRRTNLTVHREIYQDTCVTYNKMLLQSRKDYYSSKIEECSNDQRQLFKLTNILMGSKREAVLPIADNDKNLADQFSDYFTRKVASIRDKLNEGRDENDILRADSKFEGDPLVTLAPVTSDEVEKIISCAASKSCELDPIPTTLLKSCLGCLLPIISAIVNTSLSKAEVPSNFKQAVVRPLLKKPGLDQDTFKNYRPVSNLPFLSKVLEKVVAKQLEGHLDRNKLHDDMQSAYRARHSTETALLRVHQDIAAALDNNSAVVLIMLDLSAAFDVIDHPILLKRLEYSYGISGSALTWFRSYVSNRSQRVAVRSAFSDYTSLNFGVPQGSVLGPRKYCMFSKPIGDICKRHNMLYHGYADDTQSYLVIDSRENWNSVVPRLEVCLSDISSWMHSNMLKINQDKTELIIFAPKHHAKDLSNCELLFDGTIVHESAFVKNLGAYFDQTLSMDKQANAISKSCFFHLRNIGRIRPFITMNACKTLINSLVTSRLDYANVLLAGVNSKVISKLQRVQNTAARLITQTKKHEHITPVLYSLHWLPIPFRVQYKVLIYTYKIKHDLAPVYMNDLISEYKPSRSLRSDSANFLNTPRTRTKGYGERRFDKCAATLWNSLPADMRRIPSLTAFKKALKTHLFKIAFN